MQVNEWSTLVLSPTSTVLPPTARTHTSEGRTSAEFKVALSGGSGGGGQANELPMIAITAAATSVKAILNWTASKCSSCTLSAEFTMPFNWKIKMDQSTQCTEHTHRQASNRFRYWPSNVDCYYGSCWAALIINSIRLVVRSSVKHTNTNRADVCVCVCVHTKLNWTADKHTQTLLPSNRATTDALLHHHHLSFLKLLIFSCNPFTSLTHSLLN